MRIAEKADSRRRSTPYFSSTMAGMEISKPIVIFDIGQKLTKFGFAGEFCPSGVMKTQLLDNLKLHRNIFEPSSTDGTYNLELIFLFFRDIYCNHLITAPKDRRVVVVESVLCPTDLKTAICEVLLDKLEVPSLLFIPGHLAATLPFNTKNTLVVDVGFRETLALPIADGVTILNNWEVSAVGSRQLEDRVRGMLKKLGKVKGVDGSIREITDEDSILLEEFCVVEDIVTKYLFCTSRERLQSKDDETRIAVKDALHPLGTETLIVSGLIREFACEVFFEDDSDDSPSVVRVILEAVKKSPLDLKKVLLQGILCIGGAVLLPGFYSRLKEELLEQCEQFGLHTCLPAKFYRFPHERVELFTSWIGASMFATQQDGVQVRSITREVWISEKTLPDWTDWVQNKIPCGRSGVGSA